MSILTFQAIGKYIHPTRYRQFVETESALRLLSEEQSLVSRDQKHSSQAAKTHNKNLWRAKWLKNTSERVRDTCLEFDILAWNIIYFF